MSICFNQTRIEVGREAIGALALPLPLLRPKFKLKSTTTTLAITYKLISNPLTQSQIIIHFKLTKDDQILGGSQRKKDQRKGRQQKSFRKRPKTMQDQSPLKKGQRIHERSTQPKEPRIN